LQHNIQYFSLFSPFQDILLWCTSFFRKAIQNCCLILTCSSQDHYLTIPNFGKYSDLEEIFEYKLHKLNEKEHDRYLIDAEIIAYLKCLIYTAPFKDCNAKPRRQTHELFFKNWLATIRGGEKVMCKKLKVQLKI
jgi:hypothetical protein